MAGRGDTVVCSCGERLTLTNDRIPWHKKPSGAHGRGLRGTCQFSGVPAEGWSKVVGDVLVNCPGCGDPGGVVNAPEGSRYPLVCKECGTAGTVGEFARPIEGTTSGALPPRSRAGHGKYKAPEPEITPLRPKHVTESEATYKARLEKQRAAMVVRRGVPRGYR